MSSLATLDPGDVVRYEPGVLRLLDQTALPAVERHVELTTVTQVAEAITSLRVRGAPLIGIVAAYGVALAARAGQGSIDAVERAAALLRATRPTAVNLEAALRRVVASARAAPRAGDVAAAAEAEARAIHAEVVAACLAMSEAGAALVGHGARVCTHCNTGALATGGIGTALGVIVTAHRAGRVRDVWVPETRPLLQGARLTAWELQRAGVPSTVLCDSAVGSVFAAGEVDAVIVGADRITVAGDVANKIGTYTLAVLAAHHGVPFSVVAPTSTIDADIERGSDIRIELRDSCELRGTGDAVSVPSGVPVHNPAFDVTPAGLVTAIVTELGVHRPPYAFSGHATGTRAISVPSAPR